MSCIGRFCLAGLQHLRNMFHEEKVKICRCGTRLGYQRAKVTLPFDAVGHPNPFATRGILIKVFSRLGFLCRCLRAFFVRPVDKYLAFLASLVDEEGYRRRAGYNRFDSELAFTDLHDVGYCVDAAKYVPWPLGACLSG